MNEMNKKTMRRPLKALRAVAITCRNSSDWAGRSKTAASSASSRGSVRRRQGERRSFLHSLAATRRSFVGYHGPLRDIPYRRALPNQPKRR